MHITDKRHYCFVKMSEVKLQSSEGKLFNVDIQVARKSELIKTFLDTFERKKEDTSTHIIPLPNVNSNMLERVIQWITHHLNDPPVVKVKRRRLSKDASKNFPDSWDVEFFNVERRLLLELLSAANYLDIDDLVAGTGRAIASLIVGKSVIEIRELFGDGDELTIEELAEIREESEFLRRWYNCSESDSD